MATLSVLKFDTPGGAQQMLATLERLQKQQLIEVQDAAIVTWEEGKKKPKTQQLHSMAGIGALGGAFWGMLFGLLFFIPFLGLALGAAIGALAGHFSDYGIDDKFINSVKDKVTPGTSALFLLTSNAVVDKIAPELKGQKFEIIQTNLSKEQEDALRAAFAEGETEPATTAAATEAAATDTSASAAAPASSTDAAATDSSASAAAPANSTDAAATDTSASAAAPASSTDAAATDTSAPSKAPAS